MSGELPAEIRETLDIAARLKSHAVTYMARIACGDEHARGTFADLVAGDVDDQRTAFVLMLHAGLVKQWPEAAEWSRPDHPAVKIFERRSSP